MHSLRGEWKFNLSLSYKINLQNNRKLLQYHYLPLHSFNMIYAHNTDNNLQYLYVNKKYLKEKNILNWQG